MVRDDQGGNAPGYSRLVEIATAESCGVFRSSELTTKFDVLGTVGNLAFFAGAARNLEGRSADEYTMDHTSIIRREPNGVVASIASRSHPFQMVDCGRSGQCHAGSSKGGLVLEFRIRRLRVVSMCRTSSLRWHHDATNLSPPTQYHHTNQWGVQSGVHQGCA